jgi:hypothetical protein
MESLTLDNPSEGSESVSDAASSVAGTETSSRTLPPHLAGFDTFGTASETASTTSETHSRNGEGWIPPHLRGRVGSTSSTGESRSDEGQLPPHLRGPRSISTATTTREEKIETKKSKQVDFNAWDAKGAQHAGVKSPTISSGASSTTASITDSEGNGVEGQRGVSQPETSRQARGNWPAKVVSRHHCKC